MSTRTCLDTVAARQTRLSSFRLITLINVTIRAIVADPVSWPFTRVPFTSPSAADIDSRIVRYVRYSLSYIAAPHRCSKRTSIAIHVVSYNANKSLFLSLYFCLLHVDLCNWSVVIFSLFLFHSSLITL